MCISLCFLFVSYCVFPNSVWYDGGKHCKQPQGNNDILDLVPHHATLEGWTWTWHSLAGSFVISSNKRLQHYDLVVIRTSQNLAPTHNRSIPTNTATCCCAPSQRHRRQGRHWVVSNDIPLPRNIYPGTFATLLCGNIWNLEKTVSAERTSHWVNGISIQANFIETAPRRPIPKVSKYRRRSTSPTPQNLLVHNAGHRVWPS